VPEHFSSIVSKYGDRPAVICRSPTTSGDSFPRLAGAAIPNAVEERLTYHQLDLVSNSLAHSLRSLGVKKGDRIAVSLGNNAEFAAVTYAIFKLGVILVPLNPGFNSTQVAAALNHLGVETLIIGAVTDLAYKPCRGRGNLELLRGIIPNLDQPKIESTVVPTLKNVVIVDNSASHPETAFDLARQRAFTPFSTLLQSAQKPVQPDTPLRPDETINIQFTSGTTSHPKAAMLSHTSILNNGALIAHQMRLTPADKIVCPPPLFHCFGCILGYMATATTGASILFPSPAFDPRASMRMAADHEATGLYGVVTMFLAMLEAQADRGVLSAAQAEALRTHLRTGIAAGSSVPEAVMRRLFERLGLEDLVICYGMTETSPVSCMTVPSDPLEKRTGSVGRAMPHTRVKVVDPLDRTRILHVGERGELAASGYLVMKGYWDDEERTREVRVWEPDDGEGQVSLGAGETVDARDYEKGRVWMYSGDEASMDAEGYVQITGRIKDLIIRGGENIHPLEIENCLFQHPAVAEVSVVGVPDERHGECVGAFVVLHREWRALDGEGGGEARRSTGSGSGGTVTADEVRQWVRTRLSTHLVPKHVFWYNEFPKTASGKIKKFQLRDIAKELLGMGEKSGLP
jgi:acyl-CoA synthetase (AMP-forming)/AMP-acid ligase II